MSFKRIIAKIDIKGENVVKGVHFEGLRVLGKPNDFASYYYNNGIDEIFFQDIIATLYGNNCLFEFISKISENIFIPIIVGGGIRTLKDIEKMFIHGADRVSLNSAVIKNRKFLNDAARVFGSANIAVNIEVLKKNNNYFAYYEYGRENSNLNVMDWARKVQEDGAGEIILSSIDFDGTGKGFEVELLKEIKQNISIPITIHGGCSKIDQIVNVFRNDISDAIALSSVLHYNYLRKKIKTDKKNFNFSINDKWEDFDIKKIKKTLIQEKIKVRI